MNIVQYERFYSTENRWHFQWLLLFYSTMNVKNDMTAVNEHEHIVGLTGPKRWTRTFPKSTASLMLINVNAFIKIATMLIQTPAPIVTKNRDASTSRTLISITYLPPIFAVTKSTSVHSDCLATWKHIQRCINKLICLVPDAIWGMQLNDEVKQQQLYFDYEVRSTKPFHRLTVYHDNDESSMMVLHCLYCRTSEFIDIFIMQIRTPMKKNNNDTVKTQ